MTRIQIITPKQVVEGETDLEVDELTRLIHGCYKEQVPFRTWIDGTMWVIPFSVLDESIIRLDPL
jgi:hypothetical protein